MASDSNTKELLGQEPHYINDTAEHKGRFISIQALTDCTFTTLTSNITGNTLTTLAEGTTIGGEFTTIQLTSGSLIAYKGAF